MFDLLTLAAGAGLLAAAQQTPYAEPRPAPRIEAFEAAEGARVVYAFGAPARRLRLAAPLAPGLAEIALDGAPGLISRGEAGCGSDCAFTRAEADFFPGAAPGAVFPAVIDAGRCGLWLDLSAVVPIDPGSGAPLARAISLNGEDRALTLDAPDYAALRAPEAAPACTDLDLVAQDRLAASAQRMTQDFGRIFGRLDDPARVILTEGYLGERGRGGIRGAAVDEDMVFLFAEAGAEPDRDQLLSVLSHELAHLWVGRRARLHPDFHEAWIIEGAAEYLALKQLLRTDFASETFVLDAVSRHVSACLSALDRRRLRLGGTDEGGPFGYNCGVLISFYADAAARRAGSSFEAIAADMVADAAFRAHDATPVDYLRILSAHVGTRAGAELRDQVLAGADRGKERRVLDLFAARGLGRETSVEEADRLYLAGAAAGQVIEALCPDGGGSWWIDETVVIDLPRACRGPAGTSELLRVEGADLMTEPALALERIEQACAANRPMTLRLSADEAAVRCTLAPREVFRGFALDQEAALAVLTAAP